MFNNSKFLVHPRELDDVKNPKNGDCATVRLINKILSKMSVNAVQDGYKVADGVRIMHTPGHTSGRMSVCIKSDDGNIIVSGDAPSDGESITRGLPQNVFMINPNRLTVFKKWWVPPRFFILDMTSSLKLAKVLSIT